MSRHAPLWCSLSIVAVLLLSACQVVPDEKEAAEASAQQDWLAAFGEFAKLEGEAARARSALLARTGASGKVSEAFVGEWEDALEAYRDGPYDFVAEGGFPKFSEVRGVNDRICAYVEAVLEQKILFIHHVKESQSVSRKSELFDESQALRIQNNRERRAIWDMAVDLRNPPVRGLLSPYGS